jgi:hypothetical protein
MYLDGVALPVFPGRSLQGNGGRITVCNLPIFRFGEI